ncbi:protein FAR1-RELATED SEQUENCE 5-like [Argentina anserina]|uniref:protein FAR1-RELATED SEQUENCE 5-like n=1 Tax=Argentina anserina TaxID=57926 RepID=UPI0021769125|nr:protein FAR1-RELATED SEQUENCE 5-like [Potentilla anserina]
MEESEKGTECNLEQSKEDLLWTPKYNMEFDYEKAAYDFYNDYGHHVGFSIRRDGCGGGKYGVLTTRNFVCCKESEPGKDKRDDLTKNPIAQTRTGCGALMVIKLDRPTELDGAFIDLTVDSRVPLTSTFELMGRQARGRESLGFTKQD